MDNDHTIGIIVAIIVAIIFFGGWYVFFGQSFNQSPNETDPEATLPAGQSGIVIEQATNTDANATQTLPTQ